MKEHARIVHGSHLRLDQPVSGLRRLGQLRREIFRDCTLLALRRLVEQVRARQVDLLLLTGPCCPEDGLGPRGALALAEACQSLAQSRIPMVLTVSDGELVRQGYQGRGWPGGWRTPPHQDTFLRDLRHAGQVQGWWVEEGGEDPDPLDKGPHQSGLRLSPPGLRKDFPIWSDEP